MMGSFLRGDRAVPLLISKCYVKEEPKITKTRRFVGFKQGLGTLVYKAIELVQECFWDEEQEIENEGSIDVVNYAIDILDDPGQGQPELIVTKLDGKSRPAAGFFCQLSYPRTDVEEANQYPYAPQQAESSAKLVRPKQRRPEQEGRPSGNPLPPPEMG